MNYMSLDQFFEKYLRTGQHWNKKKITLTDAIWQLLAEDTFLFGKEIPKGSRFKCCETDNFGYIIFAPEVVDCDGVKLDKRIYKY